ncbi:unnamed protein product [Symbiodinium microadriaticum]|nr:unnamed protein product [Symbiodinium sp. KB8]CAE7868017.1 unnamed protein product [Symbiodinium microadriaticum]
MPPQIQALLYQASLVLPTALCRAGTRMSPSFSSRRVPRRSAVPSAVAAMAQRLTQPRRACRRKIAKRLHCGTISSRRVGGHRPYLLARTARRRTRHLIRRAPMATWSLRAVPNAARKAARSCEFRTRCG